MFPSSYEISRIHGFLLPRLFSFVSCSFSALWVIFQLQRTLRSSKSSSFTHGLDFSSFHKTPCLLIPVSSGFSHAYSLHHGLIWQYFLKEDFHLHSYYTQYGNSTLDFVRRASNRRQYDMFPSL